MGREQATPMIRRVRNTFDWEYMVRCLMAAALLYVVGTAVLHAGGRGGGASRAVVGQAVR